MKKIFIITLLSIFVVSCGTKTEEIKQENNLENKPQIHTKLKPKTPEQKYGKLAKYIKSDLTLKEDQELQKILKERKQLILKVKKELIEAKKQGKFEEKMQEVEKQREEIANKILPFVDDEKKDEFKKSCKKGNELLRKKFG